MEDNNFVQKFDVNQKSNSKQIFSAILISFISAIIGGACALGIYLGIDYNPKDEIILIPQSMQLKKFCHLWEVSRLNMM